MTSSPPPLQRIVVVGPTGSGKTTLAQTLARRLDLPHIETDAIYWGPNWTEPNRDEFRQKMDLALRGERWVIDGNYSSIRDISWRRADTLVWLDYPFLLVFWRLLRRTIPRVISGEVLWGTNRETVRDAFFSRESLFVWLLKSYPRQKRNYPRLVQQPEFAHLSVVRLKSPRETDEWLAKLSAVQRLPIQPGTASVEADAYR